MQRKIIHIDCDCFFAAVEMRDDPSLLGRPIAIGGSPEGRGVLSTCNYEARQFGLHSAMSSAEALRRCPHLTLLPHRFEAYREASKQVNEIFHRYTEFVEPLSLDEAYLDVSSSQFMHGSATLIAKEIRSAIKHEVGITASAGIAPNKFLAKVASDWNKPDGQFVITPDDVAGFVYELPVKKIPGVGQSTMKKMKALHIETCGDLQQKDLYTLVKTFGAFGERLYKLSHGKDERPLRTHRVRKSVSVEKTFAVNLVSTEQCIDYLDELINKLHSRFDKYRDAYAVNKVFVKIKFSDFKSTTAEVKADTINKELLARLIDEARTRSNLEVRLIGIGVGVSPIENEQMSLGL